MATELALSSCENSSTGICSDTNLLCLGYADHVIQVMEDPNKLTIFLDRPNDNAGMYEIHFAH